MRRRISPWPAAIALMLGASHAATYAQPATTTKTAAPGKPTETYITPGLGHSKAKLAATPAKPTAKPAVKATATPVKPAADDSTPPPPPPPPPAFPAPAKHGPKPAGVAAVVNGVKITDSAVATQAMKQAGPQIVQNMIISMLIDQDAKKQGINVDAEINAQIAVIRKQVAGQPGSPTLESFLAKQNLTLTDVKNNLRPKLTAEKIVGKNFKAPLMVHVRHILVPTVNLSGDPKAPVHTDDEAKAIIAKAQADLKAGKSFDEVAKTYSEDPGTKDKGGDLGIINANTQFDPNFLQAALKLKAGEVTAEPVKSQYGYHLIKVDSTNDNPPAAEKAEYATAAKQAKDQFVGQGLQAYVQQLQAKAKVVNYLAP